MSATQDRPPPPPPPAPAAVNGQALAEEWNRVKQRRREVRRQTWVQRFRAVNPSYWRALGVIVGIGLMAAACREYTKDQRDTALAVASLAAGASPTVTSEPPPTVPFPNPLDSLGVSNQAAWVIGIDGDGLMPARSSYVVEQMLRTLDLCQTFVGIDAAGVLFVSTSPVPGSYPLVVEGCDAASTTTAPGA